MSGELRAALFDLDGTLMNTPDAIAHLIAAVLTGRGHRGVTVAAARSSIGVPLDEAFAQLMALPGGHAAVGEAVAEYRRLYDLQLVPRALDFVYEGVPEGLAALRQAGFKLAVVTNKIRRATTPLLAAGGLLDFFDVVIAADLVARPKPFPDMGERALRELGVRAKDAVMVGDTVHDLRMANALGTPAVALTYGVQGEGQLLSESPAWVAHSFPEAVGFIVQGRAVQV